MASENQWHLDRRVPISLILAIIIQTSAFVWYAASITFRVDNLEISLARHESIRFHGLVGDRIMRLETYQQNIVEELKDLNKVMGQHMRDVRAIRKQGGHGR